MDDRSLLRVFLMERGASCPRCRYSLRGLEGDACPECGLTLVLGVMTGNPLRKLIPWVIGLSAWTWAPLVAVLALSFFVGFAIRHGISPLSVMQIGPVGIGFLIVELALSTIGIGVWVQGFRGRGVLSRTNRWCAAVIAWAVTIAPVIVANTLDHT